MIDIGPGESVAPDALGVDMSHGRAISVGACWIEGESAHLEEVWAGDDPDKAVDVIALMAGRRIPVVVDSASPATSLVYGLRQRKVNVVVSTASDMAAACGEFENRSKPASDTLTHGGQDSVTTALKGARKRPIRDAGGWGWDRRDPTSIIHQLVAVTLALGSASKAYRPRDGRKRKAVIG